MAKGKFGLAAKGYKTIPGTRKVYKPRKFMLPMKPHRAGRPLKGAEVRAALRRQRWLPPKRRYLVPTKQTRSLPRDLVDKILKYLK